MSQPASSENDPRYRAQQSPLASQRAKQQKKDNDTSEQSKRQYFPLSAKDGFSQWWANISPAAAEHKVLSFVPYLQKPPTQRQTGNKPVSRRVSASEPSSNLNSSDDLSKTVSQTTESSVVNDPYGPRRWHSSLIKLAGKNRAINEFSIERVGEEVTQNLVLLHGYGAGLGFFYKNFEPLSRMAGWRLYALDLLGMGRSSRPPFRIYAKDHQGKITEAEQWFVESLEEWRKEKGIDRLTLLGHSLGGYMAVCYALKYPSHINKLILASPVGIPEDPYAVSSELPEPDDSTVAEEFAQDQSQSTTKAQNNASEPRRRQLPKWLTVLWDANFSPFSIVRWAGPLGPRLVSGWTSRRFSQLPQEEAQALHDYAYSLFRQRGSGEYALGYILAPGAFARSPLIRRIGDVGRVSGPLAGSASKPASINSSQDANRDMPSNSSTPASAQPDRGIPVTLIYGENDWMDVAGGYAAAEKIKEAKEKALEGASAEEKRRDEGSAEVFIVRKAGHHVYLDGWEQFNELMEQEMKDVEVRERSRQRWINHDAVLAES